MSVIEKALAKAREEARAVDRPHLDSGMTPDVNADLDMSMVSGIDAMPDAASHGESSSPILATADPLPIDAPPRRAKTHSARAAMAFAPGEEYRLLKERLLSMGKKDMLNLFMVTSPARGEGKSTISFNLAISLAHEFDHTSLLIDADMRGATCHSMLGLERTPGLSDCLLNGSGFHEALVHTGIGRMAFIPAGSAIDNPAELFSSNRMHALLLEIKHRYPDRVIIIDTPPILPFAETRSLSRMVDGSLLVVRENVTARDSLDSALQCLEGSTLLGLIYNDSKILNREVEGYGA